MQFIELPTLNEDGSVESTVRVGPEEVKTLLQFAINFLGSVGATAVMTQESQKDYTSLND